MYYVQYTYKYALVSSHNGDSGEACRLWKNGVYSPLKNASSFVFMALGVPISASTPSQT